MNALFKTLISGVLSSFLGGKSGTQAALIGAVVSALTQQGGNAGQGLSNLVQNFDKNGLGEIAKTWVGTGQNAAINPEQIQQGMGQGMVQQIAKAAGMNPDQASAMLTKVLPNLVDQLTPNGAIDNQAVSGLIKNVVGKLAA